MSPQLCKGLWETALGNWAVTVLGCRPAQQKTGKGLEHSGKASVYHARPPLSEELRMV